MSGKTKERLAKEDAKRADLKAKVDDHKSEREEANKKDIALKNKFMNSELTVIDPKGIAYSDKEGIVQRIRSGAKLAPKLIEQNCFHARGIQALIDDKRLKIAKGGKDEDE